MDNDLYFLFSDRWEGQTPFSFWAEPNWLCQGFYGIFGSIESAKGFLEGKIGAHFQPVPCPSGGYNWSFTPKKAVIAALRGSSLIPVSRMTVGYGRPVTWVDKEEPDRAVRARD